LPVNGRGGADCVEGYGCKAVICWFGCSGVGALAASSGCVRARCFLGGVGVPLCVSCVRPRGSGLCCGVGGRLFPLGVVGSDLVGFGYLSLSGHELVMLVVGAPRVRHFKLRLRFVFALHW